MRIATGIGPDPRERVGFSLMLRHDARGNLAYTHEGLPGQARVPAYVRRGGGAHVAACLAVQSSSRQRAELLGPRLPFGGQTQEFPFHRVDFGDIRCDVVIAAAYLQADKMAVGAAQKAVWLWAIPPGCGRGARARQIRTSHSL